MEDSDKIKLKMELDNIKPMIDEMKTQIDNITPVINQLNTQIEQNKKKILELKSSVEKLKSDMNKYMDQESDQNPVEKLHTMDLSSCYLNWEQDPELVEYRKECLEFIESTCEFRCVCYKNQEKYNSMKSRFDSIGLNLQIYKGVPHTDPRIINGVMTKAGKMRNIPQQLQRLWSVTYGHIDMIRMFYNSGKEFGLFCEDDIFVNRTLPFHLPHIVSEAQELDLDVILLGYMKTFQIESWMSGHELISAPKNRPYSYHRYPDDQWGVHLYMVSRAGARKILDEYEHTGYADIHVNNPDKSFSPDWTVTKCPGLNRALIAPMFAVEDGKDPYEHYAHDGQYAFHMETTRANYVPGLFI